MPGRLAKLSDDTYLNSYRMVLERRTDLIETRARRLAEGVGSLAEFACAHEYYGLHARDDVWVLREWAPNATAIFLVGDFSNWERREEFALWRIEGRDVWEGTFPRDAIRHGQRYHLELDWDGGGGERIPAYARRVVQNAQTLDIQAQVWEPEQPYVWRAPLVSRKKSSPIIYEAHIGMAQEQAGIGTYDEFRRHVLPRVIDGGYNTLQLMAVMEHPYYASFGYQVSSFFAASSRFGTPEELKALIDAAHEAGLAVIMDLVHSHAVRNEREGLSRFDGTYFQYFHDGSRGWHDAWDSRCFDYGRLDVLHFLLSNCRYWLDEFRFDGFRFDGVTSMLYLHHGLGVDFVDYRQYFDDMVDEDALAYLALSNLLIHELRPDAMVVAEDVSGMPGLAAPIAHGGIGFDYRMAMGVPECWFKLVRDVRDEDWSIGFLWHELTNRRDDEQTVNYVECHDQAMVGGKTLLFQMMDASIYDSMHRGVHNPATDRAVALHKMIRMATISTAGHGYLNFMGNEFGHPEWIDFPREGNQYSYQYARRMWHLRDDPGLYFHCLGEFDRAMIRNVAASGMLERWPPRLLLASEIDKILVFARGSYVFAFNFHREISVEDFSITVPPGTYRCMLDTDRSEFGGFGRVARDQIHVSESKISGAVRHDRIRIYFPCRTALMLHREG